MNQGDTVQRLHEIVMLLNEQIGVNFFSIEEAFAEKDNISILDEEVFNKLAGLVVQMTSVYYQNNLPMLHAKQAAEYNNVLKSELSTLTNYLSTLLVPKLFERHDEVFDRACSVLRKTVITWSKEFVALMSLIVVFDSNREKSYYRDLAAPLAQLAVNIIYAYFEESGAYETN